MSELMEQALKRLRSLSENRQDELAPVLVLLADTQADAFELTADDEAALEMSHAQALRGEFATDEEIRATWAKHGL